MNQRFPTAALLFTLVSLVGGGTAHAQADGPMLAAARREVARLSVGSAADAQASAAPGPSWAARHPVALGMAAGTAAGFALSRVDAIGGVKHDPRVALLGTAVGAWGGLIGSAVIKARSGDRVGLGTKIGIAAGAVALVVGPWLACFGAGGCGGTS